MRKMRLTLIMSLLFLATVSPVFGAPEVPAASAPAQPVGASPVEAKSPAAPAPLPMKARFASKTVEAGDTVNLLLSFSLPEKAVLNDPPRISGIPGGPFDAKRTDSGLVLTLLADTLGSFRVGPLTLEYADKDGNRRTLLSEPAAISVTTALASDPKAQSPRPMKELLPVGFAYKRQVIIASAVLALLLASFLLWRFFSRRKKKFISVHTIAPHEAALFALARLEDDDTLSAKVFAFRLSAILRTYMGSIRDFPAAEMTFEEISAAASLAEDREILPVLRATDMVKFAEHLPSVKDRAEQVARVRAYVEATRPALTDGAALPQPGEARP